MYEGSAGKYTQQFVTVVPDNGDGDRRETPTSRRVERQEQITSQADHTGGNV